MRIPRLYIPQALAVNSEIELEKETARYVVSVLRLKAGNPLVLFNGKGGEYQAELTVAEKRKAHITIRSFDPAEKESPLRLHLAVGISKGDRMDYAIQKAVETGVTELTPLLTEYCAVSLNAERMQKRLAHWQGIIHSACEQCGRNRLPVLNPAIAFEEFCDVHRDEIKLVLDPLAKQTPSDITTMHPAACTLCVGPEGGLSQAEIKRAQQHDFIAIKMGPRILRTETAAVVAVTSLQLLWGDLK